MRATLYIFILTLLTTFSLNAQFDTTNVVYFDNVFRSEPDIEYASYYGVPKKINNNKYQVTFYTLKGQLFAVGEYNNPKLKLREGLFVQYDQRGRIILAAHYHNNLMHGVFQTFHSNGIQADSGQMNRNFYIGLWKSWYPNGRLKDIKTYKLVGTIITGIEGEYRSWDPKGRLVDSGYYKDGNKTGVWVEWKWNGEMHGYGGHQTDVPTDWARYGPMRSLGTYKKGFKDGDWKYYDTTGKLLYMRRYTKKEHDEDGELLLIKKD